MTAKQTAQVYYDLGNAYSRLGEQDKATAAYLNALKLDSSLLQASYNLARAYIESGSFAKAVGLLEGLLSKDPENLTVLDTLGYAYYKEGDGTRALGYYDQVLALSPVDENALYNRSMILSEEGKGQEAIDGFQKLYSISTDPNLLLLLGKLELSDKKPDKGIHYLEAYRVAKPDDFDGLKVLADAYRSEKLYDKALSAYDAAIAIKPTDSGVLFSKAEILLTAIQDEANGLKALKAALDSGFADRKAINTLLANPELVGKHAIETLLESKNLLDAQPSRSPATPPSKG
ncbi:MAG TPA: tetratricopeptide repeat protein [Spirochaetia bacterium]|nr:tetratricopeptide repeat protein [Spirochaetia bacterium]